MSYLHKFSSVTQKLRSTSVCHKFTKSVIRYTLDYNSLHYTICIHYNYYITFPYGICNLHCIRTLSDMQIQYRLSYIVTTLYTACCTYVCIPSTSIYIFTFIYILFYFYLYLSNNTGILRDEPRWRRVDTSVEALPNASACNRASF